MAVRRPGFDRRPELAVLSENPVSMAQRVWNHDTRHTRLTTRETAEAGSVSVAAGAFAPGTRGRACRFTTEARRRWQDPATVDEPDTRSARFRPKIGRFRGRSGGIALANPSNRQATVRRSGVCRWGPTGVGRPTVVVFVFARSCLVRPASALVLSLQHAGGSHGVRKCRRSVPVEVDSHR